jgi:hypothetical protein
MAAHRYAGSEWLYPVLPLSVLACGLGIFVPLDILTYGGTVFDIGIAFAAAGAAGMLGSLVWGEFLNKTHSTHNSSLISAAGILLALVLLILGKTGYIMISFSAFTFFSAGIYLPINIFAMGRRGERKMTGRISAFKLLSIVGCIAASAFGVAIGNRALMYYLAFLMLSGIVCFAAVYVARNSGIGRLMEYGKSSSSRRRYLRFASGRVHGLVSHMLYGLHRHEIKKGQKSNAFKKIYVLIASFSAMTIGFSLLATSFIPFLYAHGISYQYIFGFALINMLAQAAIYYRYSGKGAAAGPQYNKSTFLIGAAGLTLALSLPAYIFIPISLLAYAAAGISISMFAVSSLVLFYNNVRGNHEARYIGILSAVGGGSVLVGAAASGYISQYYGYPYSFGFVAIAGVIAYVLMRSRTAKT